MATATKVLRHEHEAILKILDVTEKVANRLERGEAVRQEVLANLQEFFRLFADQCHHGKEEDLLFPLLEQKGIPRTGGPSVCCSMNTRKDVRSSGKWARLLKPRNPV